MADFIPHTETETREMLGRIGIGSLDELLSIYAQSTGSENSPDLERLGSGCDERALLSWFGAKAGRNWDAGKAVVFRGAGAYEHFIPSAVGALIGRGEFLTSYTPYQPEASQGLLQAIFEFQTAISRLYGMDLSNASLYDGATALAEAVLVAIRETERSVVLLSEGLDPEVRSVVGTYLEGLSVRVETVPIEGGRTNLPRLMSRIDQNVSCFVGAIPTFFGTVDQFDGVAEALHGQGGLLILHANPHALALLKTPGEWNADLATGEGQPLGIPLSSGGPYLGILTARKKFVRRIPGRLAGLTRDREGSPCYVLTLQAREQHIRREKANSNICSNETLLALQSLFYLALLGPSGIRRVASGSWSNAHYLFRGLTAIPGVTPLFEGAEFFHEFVLDLPENAGKISERLLEYGILGGLPLEKLMGAAWSHRMLWCATEVRTKEEMDRAVDQTRLILSS
jgi:glycine dehydrogenase subunit 1